VASPETTDGRSAGQQPTQADVAEIAEPRVHPDPGRAVTRQQRALTAAFVPVTRTLQRIRPAGSRLRAATWLRPVREVPWLRPVRGLPWLRPADAAGVLLARLTVLPAVLLVAWLIPAVPLLLGHVFLPLPALLISVPLAIVLIFVGLRVVPAGWPRLLPARRAAEPSWATWFGLLATVAIVAGLTGWQLKYGSEALIVARDQGTYLQTGYWIAQHGSLPIPQSLTAFGGANPALNFGSTGFLVHGTSIYPAVTPGLPLLIAGASWVNGVAAATAMGPLLGGLAVLSFAGLVARLVGPQWAPAGALILGLSMPEQYVGRTTLAETALQIALFGGLCLLADSIAIRRAGRTVGGWLTVADPRAPLRGIRWFRWVSVITPERALATLGGLALGFGLVLSLDAMVYLVAVIPFGCALVLGRRPQAAAFPLGIVVGAGYGLLGCFLLDRPFLDQVGTTAGLAGVVALWLIALSACAVLLARMDWVRRTVPRALAARPLRWLPQFAALLVFAALIGLFVRPYVQKVHGLSGAAVYAFIAALQRQQGLQVDPTRTYAEQTLYWLVWYVGLPTVLLGAAGVALVLSRSLRTLATWRDPSSVWRLWALPAVIICGGTAVVLWMPDIVPDQPWASRRLVVFAIPGLIVCGLWAASWLGRRARDRGAGRVTAGVIGVFCSTAMLLPTVATTFGLGLSHTGNAGALRPVAQEGMALTQIGAGQLEAVRAMCARIPRNASVVIVGYQTAAQFAQVVRGMCGVPTAWTSVRAVSTVDNLVGSISAAGRQPVLLAGTRQQLEMFGGSPEQVLDLTTTGDPHELTQLPTSPQVVRYEVWMTQPAVIAVGT
jgi:hypothetical protein